MLPTLPDITCPRSGLCGMHTGLEDLPVSPKYPPPPKPI